MRHLQAQTEIEASAPVVWDVLTDFRHYPEWNPFIPAATGAPRAGERLRVRIRAGDSGPVTIRPQVTAAAVGRELCWRGRLGVPKLFDAEHRFVIEPLGSGRVRFVQEERFRGLLVPLFAGWLTRHIPRGFEAMNAALKARAERAGTERDGDGGGFAAPRGVE